MEMSLGDRMNGVKAMPELIDRQAALEKMCSDCKKREYNGHCPCPAGVCHKYESILQVPTAETKPMRHAYWEPNEIGEYHCTNCGIECDVDEFHKALLNRYCGNCGAVMDGGADNG